MTQTAPPIVGRDEELKRLRDLADEVSAGSPRFVQVTGEPGIGKTYLLAEFGRLADRDGWLVLSGRCSELERELPFGLVIDTFDAYLASLDPRDFDRVAADELSELAGLFPSLRSLVPTPDEPRTSTERVRAHRAVVEMLERLGARQPLLLLLDDLHWADPASVELAAFHARRARRSPQLLVATYRDVEIAPGDPLGGPIARLEAEGQTLPLGGLDAPQVAQVLAGLTGGHPDPELGTTVHRRTGGNPFLVQ